MAQENSCIFLGRCADQVLEQLMIPHISIYLCAPLEERIKNRMDRSQVDSMQHEKILPELTGIALHFINSIPEKHGENLITMMPA